MHIDGTNRKISCFFFKYWISIDIMALKFYNTLTRKKQDFKPMHDSVVKMYTCGLTVYDYAHIGNLRAYLFEDLLRRILEFEGFKVEHVQNFTDVGHLTSDEDTGEDKMELGAKREHKTAWQLAEHYISAFKKDVKELNIEEPTVWTRATDNINEMIELVKKLDERGYTYIIEDGVYFDTSKLKDYGKLAQLKKEGLKAGARVEMAEGKRNATDFALWKFSPKDKKRDMEWDSPWGRGFPGWHLECSAMAMKFLGETIDIHCGGVDHIAVHHTNEIAQSEAATGKLLAHFWLHNEHMLVEGRKMSKSLGNFYTLKQLEEKSFSPNAFRYLCLSVHYRTQMNFTFDSLRDAQNTLKSINDFVHKVKTNAGKVANRNVDRAIEKADNDFVKAIEDDMNMPNALAALFELMKAVNKEIDAENYGSLDNVYDFFMRINKVLGVIEEKEQKLTHEEKKLLELREQFRKEKDFKAADEIRNQLKERGVTIEDSPSGVRWKRV
jgi:cysteinyl-tRNA synthetase